MALEGNASSGTVSNVVYSTKTAGVSIRVGPSGLPSMMHSAGYLYLFRYTSDSSVDIAAINPSGDIRIYRDAEIRSESVQRILDTTGSSSQLSRGIGSVDATRFPSSSAVPVAFSADVGYQETWERFQFLADIAIVGGCGVAGGVTHGTAFLSPDVAVLCASRTVSLGLEITAAVKPDLEETTDDIAFVLDWVACSGSADVDSCISAIGTVVTRELDNQEESLDEREDRVEASEALLESHGYAILRWDTDGTDVDLHAWDDQGRHAYFANKDAIPGAGLDLDDIDGHGPETFSVEQRHSSYYIIKANFYRGHSSSNPTRATVEIGEGSGTTIYGPHRFSASDFNGNNPDAWWDVGTFELTASGSLVPVSQELIDETVRKKILEDMKARSLRKR